MSSLYSSGYPLCSAHQKRSVGAIVADGIRGTFITHSVTNEIDDYERLGLPETNEDGFTQIITNLTERRSLCFRIGYYRVQIYIDKTPKHFEDRQKLMMIRVIL